MEEKARWAADIRTAHTLDSFACMEELLGTVLNAEIRPAAYALIFKIFNCHDCYFD